MEKKGYTYILFNHKYGALYVGVTSNLRERLIQHKEHLFEGYTKRYNIDKLGYYEEFQDILSAISREKQLKAGPRRKKVELIESINPNWVDLYDDVMNVV